MVAAANPPPGGETDRGDLREAGHHGWAADHPSRLEQFMRRYAIWHKTSALVVCPLVTVATRAARHK